MPRLPPTLIRHARQISPNLALVLLACRDLPSARAELRWLTEHVTISSSSTCCPSARLGKLARLRSRGVPLQYLLSSQPFGPLDIICRRGVLIPRPETEAYTIHLAGVIRSRFKDRGSKPLAILDLCSGTGCIALLLFSLLRDHFPSLHVLGVDVSPVAVTLSRRNALYNSTCAPLTATQTVTFLEADVFSPSFLAQVEERQWNVVVSNPPYIDPSTWACGGRGDLGLSVRRFEPELALVAPADAPLGTTAVHRSVNWERRDAFYGRLAELVRILKPGMALWEVGDQGQARRVLDIIERMGLDDAWDQQVWRDWPDMMGESDHDTQLGSGSIRSIFMQRR